MIKLSQSLIFKPAYKVILGILLGIFCLNINMSGQIIDDDIALIITDSINNSTFQDDEIYSKEVSSFWDSYISKPMRITLTHEISSKIKAPAGIINNRSSVQMEYSKLFFNNIYFQLDTKIISYWKNDHQAKAEDKDIYLRQRLREAFLQSSFGNTSVKIGYQLLIWGESDLVAITDIVSPRNYSEIFFIPLEEARISQAMITIDHFSRIGDWSCFFIPIPDYNEYAKSGSEYGSALSDSKYPNQKLNNKDFEYGIKWKKTFNRSDISIMAASTIDNNHYTNKQRFNMLGTTFNYAKKVFLLKGEFAIKSSQNFPAIDKITYSGKVVQKNTFESSLSLEYSPGANFTSSIEHMQIKILGWNREIQYPNNNNTLVLNLGNKFLHDDLSVNLLTYYFVTNTAFFYALKASYQWNDRLNFMFSFFYPDFRNDKNDYYLYRNQKQVGFNVRYQF